MIAIITIAVLLWAVSAMIRASKDKRRERAEQIERERNARMRQEWREMQRDAKLEVDRMIALEREQMRQRKEQERIAKEQEKQAAQLAKHEERLFKLEQKLELAERDEEHWSETVSAIRIDMAGLEGYINYCKAKGLLCKGKEDELAKKRDKLYAAETKLIKARQARELCEMQMSA